MLELIIMFPFIIAGIIIELIDIKLIISMFFGVAIWDLFKFIYRDWKKR